MCRHERVIKDRLASVSHGSNFGKLTFLSYSLAWLSFVSTKANPWNLSLGYPLYVALISLIDWMMGGNSKLPGVLG